MNLTVCLIAIWWGLSWIDFSWVISSGHLIFPKEIVKTRCSVIFQQKSCVLVATKIRVEDEDFWNCANAFGWKNITMYCVFRFFQRKNWIPEWYLTWLFHEIIIICFQRYCNGHDNSCQILPRLNPNKQLIGGVIQFPHLETIFN